MPSPRKLFDSKSEKAKEVRGRFGLDSFRVGSLTRALLAGVLILIFFTYLFFTMLPGPMAVFTKDRSGMTTEFMRMLNDTRTQSAELKAALERRLEDFAEHEHDQYKSDLDAMRGSLKGYKDEVDALRIANAELRNRTHALSARLAKTQGAASKQTASLRANQASLQKALESLRPAVPNGLILLDVRENGPVRNEQAMAWLMNARRTTHGVPVEFWVGPSTQIKPWLAGFLEANADWITVRRFPEQGDFPKSMRMPPSLALDDEVGGHIGKAYALAESAFSFPVFLDTDVFMCLGWWEKMMQLTAEHPDGDVFWTEDDSYSHKSFASTSNNRTAYVSKKEIDPVRDEYAKFDERNGGTFIAVKHTPQTRKFLIDALNIFVKQHAIFRDAEDGGLMANWATDQAALREAMFINRNKVKEVLMPQIESDDMTGEYMELPEGDGPKGKGGRRAWQHRWACRGGGPEAVKWDAVANCTCTTQCLLIHSHYGSCWKKEGFTRNGLPYWLNPTKEVWDRGDE